MIAERTIECSVCGKESDPFNLKFQYHEWYRTDPAGIYTCTCCTECYDSGKYPYKKWDQDGDDYYRDMAECGERIDDDY